jgi:hypothetical protein
VASTLRKNPEMVVGELPAAVKRAFEDSADVNCYKLIVMMGIPGYGFAITLFTVGVKIL